MGLQGSPFQGAPINPGQYEPQIKAGCAKRRELFHPGYLFVIP